jgi:hypothetical protein
MWRVSAVQWVQDPTGYKSAGQGKAEFLLGHALNILDPQLRGGDTRMSG